jgi:tetratricopeptide (TPR) repeat protein
VESALACYEEGLRRDLLREDRLDCLARLATLQKRERRWDAALPLWDRLLDEGGAYAMLARVELAKYYEHVERDYLQAIDHVQNALELSDLFEAPCPEAERRELERRLGRLVNRAMRARSWVRARG